MSARFRHEDVAAVPSGWKVRTVKAGSHRVRVAFPPGRKQKGSGRLVSVLHPLVGSNPCANPCSLRASNPAELMVMSANNPPRRRSSELRKQRQDDKIRRLLEKAAVRVEKQGHPDLAEAYREMARKNPAELLVMGANPSRRTLEREARQRSERIREARIGHNPRVEVVSSPNPPTEEIVEEFTGREVEYLDVYNEPHMPRGRYAKLGPLIALYIKPAKGGQVQRIGAAEAVGHHFPDAWGGRPPLVVCDSSAKQIYFVDGAQDISAALAAFGAIDRGNGIVELGTGRRIDYQCRKEHVASPDEDLWKHEHGEENGELPTVLFDTRSKRLLYEGGDYRIEGPWIRN
jgi:nucleotide-binding universal stress UspA family protein